MILLPALASASRLASCPNGHTLAPGLKIDVASLEDIIRCKTAAGRDKNEETLPELRGALEREHDNLHLDLGR